MTQITLNTTDSFTIHLCLKNGKCIEFYLSNKVVNAKTEIEILNLCSLIETQTWLNIVFQYSPYILIELRDCYAENDMFELCQDITKVLNAWYDKPFFYGQNDKYPIVVKTSFLSKIRTAIENRPLVERIITIGSIIWLILFSLFQIAMFCMK